MTKKVNISTDPGADAKLVGEAVARRLRDERKKQKITLDELARRAGVSKGMVVEIENSKATPSIALQDKCSVRYIGC